MVDGINLGKATSLNNGPHSPDFEPDNEDSDANVDNKPTTINKTIENNLEYIKQLCEVYIENKYMWIVKSMKMILITKKLQEVYSDLWSPHKPASISGKNYVALLLDKFTWKL